MEYQSSWSRGVTAIGALLSLYLVLVLCLSSAGADYEQDALGWCSLFRLAALSAIGLVDWRAA